MEILNDSLSRQHLYANKKQWNRFLSYFLLAAGVAFTVSGITFFFAYNWEDLPKFAKIGMVELLLIATVSLVVFTSWSKLVKQIILTGSAFLIGTLFAVFGQIYQTGADAYDLFLGWTLFTLLWAVAIRFAPLWLLFTGLLGTTLWLYAVQIVPDNEWLVSILGNAVTWIGAVAIVIAEWLYLKGRLAKYNLWFISTIAVATILHTSFLLILAIVDTQVSIVIPLLTTLLLFTSGLVFGWKQKKLFYISTIPFASLVILLSLILRHSRMNIPAFFLLTLIAIVGTTAIIYMTSFLKKQWHGTEK